MVNKTEVPAQIGDWGVLVNVGVGIASIFIVLIISVVVVQPAPAFLASNLICQQPGILTDDEVKELLEKNTPHVIRIKMPENDVLTFTDMIRGEVSFQTGLVDDKVLLKADGMPTYHLAVVVDDYLMKITHAFRGEEWLPSAPVHILLWKYLFGLNHMPQWAHLPLISLPSILIDVAFESPWQMLANSASSP